MPNSLQLAGAGVLLAAAHAAFAAPSDVACSLAQATHASAELVCPVAPAAQPTPLHLRIRFDGVHDDSFAGVALELDGQPVACEDGGRLRLQGENEGDALSCAFSAPAHDGPRQLRLRVNWSHAEPAGYTLKSGR